MHGLRGQSNVPDHGNFSLHHALDQPGPLFPAFNFDCFRARFLDEARGVTQRFRRLRWYEANGMSATRKARFTRA